MDGELIEEIVLSLHSQGDAHRLAQLLLADPLGAEEPWETELVKAGKEGEKPVLLKWVHDRFILNSTRLTTRSDSVKMQTRTLRRHRIKFSRYPHASFEHITSRSWFQRCKSRTYLLGCPPR